LLITGYETIRHRTTCRWWQPALLHMATVITHLLLPCPVSWMLNIGVHVVYNTSQVKAVRTTILDRILSAHRAGNLKVDMCSTSFTMPDVITVDSMNPEFPVGPDAYKIARGWMKIKHHGVEITPREAMTLGDFPATNKTHYLVVTNAMMSQPANNVRNLIFGLITRTHADPFTACDSPENRGKRWTKVANLIEGLGAIQSSHAEMYTEQDCIALMGPRGKRIAVAYDDIHTYGLEHYTKSVNVKHNEVLPFGKKPRILINLDPKYIAALAGESRMMSDVVKRAFDGTQVFLVGGHPVRIVYAAGYTQTQLTDIAQYFHQGVTVIVVSGDDAVTHFDVPGLKTNCETDYSQFDQSQDEGPVLIFGSKWMKLAGASDTYINTAHECVKKDYVVNKHNFQISGNGGVQMPTGVNFTTMMNSINNLSATIRFLDERSRRPTLTLEQSAKELGFNVKASYHEDVGTTTFLKGSWRRSPEGLYEWIQLPSAVLKLTKTMTHPTIICKTKDVAHAVRQVAYALGSTLRNVPDNYPILGPYLLMLRRCGTECFIQSIMQHHKPTSPHVTPIDREEAIEWIHDRYDIEPREITEFEDLCNSVAQLPVVIVSPLLSKLLAVDYA